MLVESLSHTPQLDNDPHDPRPSPTFHHFWPLKMDSFSFPTKTFYAEMEKSSTDPTLTEELRQRRLGLELIYAVSRHGVSAAKFEKSVRLVHALYGSPRALEHLRLDPEFKSAWVHVVALNRPTVSWRYKSRVVALAKLDLILSWMGSGFRISPAYLLREIACEKSLNEDVVVWKRMKPLVEFLIERIMTWDDTEHIQYLVEDKVQKPTVVLSLLRARELELKCFGIDWDLVDRTNLLVSDSDDDDDEHIVMVAESADFKKGEKLCDVRAPNNSSESVHESNGNIQGEAGSVSVADSQVEAEENWSWPQVRETVDEVATALVPETHNRTENQAEKRKRSPNDKSESFARLPRH